MGNELRLDLSDEMVMRDGGSGELTANTIEENRKLAWVAWGLTAIAALAGVLGPIGVGMGILLSFAGARVAFRARVKEALTLRFPL